MAPGGEKRGRMMIRLSSAQLIPPERIQRRSKSPTLTSGRTMRQILLVLGTCCILLICLFLYSTSATNEKNLISKFQLDFSPESSNFQIFNWEQVRQQFELFACKNFKKTSTPGSNANVANCQSPESPFDADAFRNRPSGNENLDFTRMLMLVLFNHPHAETIPFVEMLYRPHFPHIVYCLPDQVKEKGKMVKNADGEGELPVFEKPNADSMPLFRLMNATFLMDVEIVTYPQAFMNRMAGENNYKCFVEVARRLITADNATRNQLKLHDIDGILVTADDLLLHVWNFAKPGYDKDKFWLMDRPIRVYDVNKEKECAVEEPPHDSFSARVPFDQKVAEDCELDADWQWFRIYAVELGQFNLISHFKLNVFFLFLYLQLNLRTKWIGMLWIPDFLANAITD